MDAMEAILTRRSVRKYNKKPLSDEIVKDLLDVGMSAPNSAILKFRDFRLYTNDS